MLLPVDSLLVPLPQGKLYCPLNEAYSWQKAAGLSAEDLCHGILLTWWRFTLFFSDHVTFGKSFPFSEFQSPSFI